MSFLGLDVGTTGCKALVVSEDGRVIAQAYRDYPLVSPKPGWSELDARLLWESIRQVISETSRQAAADSVKALSVSSQGEAVAPVAKDGAVLGNFIVTFDSRTGPQFDWWEKRLGRKTIFAVAGMPLHPMYTINKIMWIRENRPEIYARTWKFLCIEDFVIFKLTGTAMIDHSLAARTMCLDVTRKLWSDRILRCAGIDETLLSEPASSGHAVGRVRRETAAETDLPEDVIVATGGHDQPCGALGAGAVRPSVVMNAIGTSDVLCPTLEKPILTADMLNKNYCCYPHVVRDAYASITFNLTGGLLLRWFRDTLCQEEVREAREARSDPYEIIIGRASPRPVDVYVLPHFVGSGTPTLDPESRGAFVGLTLQTTKGDLARAVLDSTNYDLRHNLECLKAAGIPVEELRVVGGGSKSASWLQMRADVLGAPLTVPRISEAAALGAAILAAVGAGFFGDARAGARAWVKAARTFEPDRAMYEEYTEKYANYLKIYPSLRKAGIQY